jgi:hypothetical protein
MYLRWAACMCAVGYGVYSSAPRVLLELLTLDGVLSRLSAMERMIR